MIDLIFADPPYFLSNDGLTIESGKIVSVNTVEWDKAKNLDEINRFNYNWLKLVKNKMKDNATIWICCSKHNLFSVGNALNELGFSTLNIITWEKTNPAPNFAKQYFNFSTEFLIWAKKDKKSKHFFNFDLIKKMNNDAQLKEVWKLPSISKWEKKFGKHPTQKPLALLSRVILATTEQNNWILDPFCGSATTGISSLLFDRRFVGIDQDEEYLKIAINRKSEIDNNLIKQKFKENILNIIDLTHQN